MSDTGLISRLKRDSILYFAGRIIPAMFSLLSISLFVQLLGEKKYGEYALLISITLLVGNISASWLTQATLRYQSVFNSDNGYKKFIKALNFAVIQTLAVSSIVVAILTYIIFHGSMQVVIAAIFIVLSSVIYAVVITRQQALLNSRKVLLADTVRAFFVFGLSVGVLYFFRDKSYFLLLGIIVAGNFFGSLVASYNINIFADIFRGNPNKRLLLILWNYGWPMALWIGAATLLNVADRYIISWLVDVKSVGIYSAIYDVIYKSFSLLLTPILSAAHPMIMNEWNIGNKATAMKLIRRTISFQLGFSVLSIAVLSSCNNLIVRFVIGREDPVAAGLILPVAIGAAAWQIAMVAHKPLELEKQTTKLLIFVTIALVVNVLLNLALIPYFGYIVAAYTTLVSFVIYFVLIYSHTMILQKKKFYNKIITK